MSAALPVHGAIRSSSAIFILAISCERSATLPQSFFGSTFDGVFRLSPRSSSPTSSLQALASLNVLSVAALQL